MRQEEKENIIKSINTFERNKEKLNGSEAEEHIIRIIEPLLNYSGFTLNMKVRQQDTGIDFIGISETQKIGFQYKHVSKGEVSFNRITSEILSALNAGLDKLILFTSGTFTRETWQMKQRIEPVTIELMDISSLKNWANSIVADQDESQIVKIIRDCIVKLIAYISENPNDLDQLEWRELEKFVAELFRGIGFKVELTPPAKDGGKDVIVECLINNEVSSYIIEIKHWRSFKRVGQKCIKDFIKVVTKERRQGGLFLSTYGYAENAIETLSEIERRKVRFGKEDKIIALCDTYMKKKSGLWLPIGNLTDVISNNTI